MARIIALVAAMLLLPVRPAQADLAGIATIVDGDTIEIHGQPIRLHGVDAPEASQLCRLGGKPWRCGQAAATALDTHVAGRSVRCQPRDRDRYGRVVAVCEVAGEDLSAWLVLNGWALAFRKYSRDYVAAEAKAQATMQGLWRGEFDAPWDWRAERRAPTTSASAPPPGRCVIKGNIGATGERIYHRPGDRYYEKTAVDTAHGERWFCSEAEARAAGWRCTLR